MCSCGASSPPVVGSGRSARLRKLHRCDSIAISRCRISASAEPCSTSQRVAAAGRESSRRGSSVSTAKVTLLALRISSLPWAWAATQLARLAAPSSWLRNLWVSHANRLHSAATATLRLSRFPTIPALRASGQVFRGVPSRQSTARASPDTRLSPHIDAQTAGSWAQLCAWAAATSVRVVQRAFRLSTCTSACWSAQRKRVPTRTPAGAIPTVRSVLHTSTTDGTLQMGMAGGAIGRNGALIPVSQGQGLSCCVPYCTPGVVVTGRDRAIGRACSRSP